MALPYGVKVFVSGNDFDNYQYPYLLTAISKFGQDSLCKVYSHVYTPFGSPNIENIKPYLRPMSSMTDEEKTQMVHDCYVISLDFEYKTTDMVALWNTPRVINWLLEHHFDFMGLILKDLAIEVTEENNPYKE